MYPQVEDEPGGDTLTHNVHEEVGDSKQPHVHVLQAVVHQQLQQAGLLLCLAYSGTYAILVSNSKDLSAHMPSLECTAA